ncbi:hypothetical protein [Kitasatospora phosalacinea]|uniref:hypothetical protein n=1 Tax=Kitasatospora phosalacinea TaxID=2065 RepID=UPI000523FF95|nr:hypothetical protein [Kitasatospora phosalacinea]
MRTHRLPAVTALSALALCGLTACGSDDGSKDAAASTSTSASAPASPSAPALADLLASEIAEKSRAAGGKLNSVTMAISLPGHKEGRLSGTFSEDNAGNCTGRYAFEGKGSVEIVRVGTDVWTKPDTAYLKATSPGIPAEAVGKWFVSDNKPTSMAYFCDLGVQLEKRVGLNTDGSPNSSLRKGDGKQVDGAPAVVLTMTDETGSPVRYDIAAEGEPRLLATESGTGDMVVRLGDFDKPVQVTAPTPDQVFQR